MTELMEEKISATKSKTILKFVGERFPNGVTAAQLVSAARPAGSPIHRYFNWDNTDAAKKWRLHQARNLLISIQVTVNDSEVKSYVNIVVGKERKYVSTLKAIKHEELWMQVVEQALNELEYWTERYSTYSKLSRLTKTIRTEKRKVETWLKRKRKKKKR